jgi:hypothetical protein
MIKAIPMVGTDRIHAVRRGDTLAHHGGRLFMVHDDIRTFAETNWLANARVSFCEMARMAMSLSEPGVLGLSLSNC